MAVVALSQGVRGVSGPKAAPAIWPYPHRTLAEVDAAEREWERAGVVNAVRWAKAKRLARDAAHHRRHIERKQGAA